MSPDEIPGFSPAEKQDQAPLLRLRVAAKGTGQNGQLEVLTDRVTDPRFDCFFHVQIYRLLLCPTLSVCLLSLCSFVSALCPTLSFLLSLSVCVSVFLALSLCLSFILSVSVCLCLTHFVSPCQTVVWCALAEENIDDQREREREREV